MKSDLKFVFVGGTPRSGTSLVQKILNNHPDIFGGPEFDHLQWLMNIFRQMKKGIQNKRQSDFYDEELLKKLYKDFIVNLIQTPAIKRNKSIVSEKTPSNILVFETLYELFPSEKYLVIVRNPYAIIASMKKVRIRAQNKKEKISNNNFIDDLNMTVRYLSSANRFYVNHAKISNLLYYEELVNDPEGVVRDLCNYLNVTYIPNMIDTQYKSEFSKRAEEDNVWYTSEMYDRKIENGELHQWQEDLTKREKILIEDAFSRLSLKILDPYSFKGKISNLHRKWFKLLSLNKAQLTKRINYFVK